MFYRGKKQPNYYYLVHLELISTSSSVLSMFALWGSIPVFFLCLHVLTVP